METTEPVEQAILKAAQEGNNERLQALLQTAIEEMDMDEEEANRLLDKVTQIVKERLQEALNWGFKRQ